MLFLLLLKRNAWKIFLLAKQPGPFSIVTKTIQAQNTFYWKKQRNELLLNILKKPNPEIGPFNFLAEMCVQFFGIDSVPNLVR